MTQVIFGPTTHAVLLASLAPMDRAIGASIGPDGRSVLYATGTRIGQASSGVDIARAFGSMPGLHGVAPALMKETLVAADRDLGDGSARLAVMARAAFRSGIAAVASGIDAGQLARACDALHAPLAAMLAEHLETAVADRDIAVGAGADAPLADAIAQSFATVGPGGTVEFRSMPGCGLEISAMSGFVFDAVCLGDGPGKAGISPMQDVHVIAADDIISDFGALAAVIDGFAQRQKSLLIVARDVTDSALAFLRSNQAAGRLSVAVMKPADAGPRAAAIIEDLAIATGAQLVAERSGVLLKSLSPQMLGRAKEMRQTGMRIELREVGGSPQLIAARATELEGEIRANRNLSLDREHAERRRARLQGRWVELRIGMGSEDETARTLAFGRNALASIRSARRSGTIAGGGIALAQVAQRVEALPGCDVARASQRMAAAALRAVGQHLRRNAGQDHLSVSPNISGVPCVFDPLALSQALVRQALSFAAQLLQVDAAVVRNRGAA